tara:strand:- start:5288 stop:5950 length:663 start_codon:yes stop_codon:yes gene_type:complete
MEHIRKCHNKFKRDLIQGAVKPGDHVLDVGCGCGGDIHKWKHLSVHVDMCDPDSISIKEAQHRAEGWNSCKIFIGDINSCPHKKYNVICYNFSIQYIFNTKFLFEKSIRNISDRLTPGGLLIGCVPNSDMILMNQKFKDSLGNFMIRKDNTGNGTWGEKLFVLLADTPFYSEGPRAEPIAYKDLLVNELKKYNIHLMSWQPFYPYSDLSKMYAYFIFQSI